MIKYSHNYSGDFTTLWAFPMPPPGTSDRKFVFTWLIGIAFVAATFVALVLIVPLLYSRH
jgi:hypothetical protein